MIGRANTEFVLEYEMMHFAVPTKLVEFLKVKQFWA